MAELYLGVESVMGSTATKYETEGIVIPGAAMPCDENISSVERWYVLSVRPRYEMLATRYLEYHRLNCFLPVYRSVRRWKDRRKELHMTLFPGYVFVNLNLQNRMAFLRAPGVLQFVVFQGGPAAVPDSEMRALQAGTSAPQGAMPHPYLQEGCKVRVKRGPLAGTEGRLIRRKERFRLVLSIDLIMRSVMFEVDEADVEPL
jgi:transcription antitermination factor NusG